MTYLARRLDNTQTPARQRLGDTQTTLKQRSALGAIMVYFRSLVFQMSTEANKFCCEVFSTQL
jgi:hypothetical protein